MEDNVFRKNLKAARKKKGLTQEELAHRLGISIMTIRRWEWGGVIPRVDEVKRLAEVLGVTEQDLLNKSPATSWRLSIRIAQDFEEEVIDLSKGIPLIASITTTRDGGLITLGGNYSNWTDDSAFKQIISELRKLRNSVIQNGKALGGIKE